jgi:NADH-quinone oxidoreductase subunit C
MTDTAPEAPALPGDGLRESIVDDLRRHIGAGLVEHLLKPQDDLWLRVRADVWAATGRALRAIGFEYFCFLSAIDWKPSPFGRGEDDPTEPPPVRSTEIKQGVAGGETRFQVFARVTDVRRHVGVTLKVDVPDDNLTLDSWHAIYAGANWHERETHEMYGIGFAGHPDLRNIYLPTEFEGYPLRKDFPLLARIVKPWPGIVDVEPMPSEDADGDGVADATADAAAAPIEGTPEAAPETAADPATVTDETVDSAPAHVEPLPADAPDTVIAEQAAPDVAPVPEEAAADVPPDEGQPS